MSVLYVDVSHHDRDRRGAPLDWAAIRSATSPVMCARLTYGDPSGYHWDTPYAAEHHAGAKAAGFIARGGYHNLISGDAACIARQVDWLRRELDSVGANWAMCDVEPYPELVDAGRWPRWDDVQQFHDRWYALESRVCAWYIPQWFWGRDVSQTGLGRPDLRGLRGPLVQSHYTGGDGTASQIYAAAGGDSGTGWDDAFGARLPNIWQYTSIADVPGATSATDVNAYRGTLDQLISLLTGADMSVMADRDAAIGLWRIEALARGTATVNGGPTQDEPMGLMATVLDMATRVKALEARPPAQVTVDATALKAVLTDPAVLAAIAKAVNDDSARRQAA